jgi:hypothetical protein
MLVYTIDMLHNVILSSISIRNLNDNIPKINPNKTKKIDG